MRCIIKRVAISPELMSMLYIYFNLGLSLFISIELKGQERKNEVEEQEKKGKLDFLIPEKTTFDAYTDFNLGFENDLEDNQWVNQLRFRAMLNYSKELNFVFVNETKFFEDKDTQNKWTQIYLNYRKRFKSNPKFPVFKHGANLRLKLGRLQWFPNFNNLQLILNNVGLYLNPEAFFGSSINVSVPVLKNRELVLHLGGHTGDLIGNKADPVLQNAYLSFNKRLIKYSGNNAKNNNPTLGNLSINTQVGLAQSRKHIVNHFHLIYAPKFEQLQLIFKVGKLPSVDESPYGIHIGFSRTFKHITISGFYESRLNQQRDRHISGFTWSIISSSRVLSLINTFSIRYNLITNSVSMFIPILKIDLNHKHHKNDINKKD